MKKPSSIVVLAVAGNDGRPLEREFPALVGGIIRARRKQLGVSSKQIAKELKLSQSGYSRVETGDTIITVTQLRAAARCVGTPAHEILRIAEGFMQEKSK